MIQTHYFAWLGTIYLILLTIKDYKNFMKVDDRLNFFMLGISISLFSHFNYKWYYALVIVAMLVGLRFLFNKFRILGRADVSSLNWIFLGFAILNLGYMMFFTVVFVVLWGFYAALAKFYTKNPVPFYPVLLISFILSAYFCGIF